MVPPHLHRNSQPRFYDDGATYFITTVTRGRHPFFHESLLAELFIRNLWFAKHLKEFDLYGYTALPEHVHLLIQPLGKANISEVMRSIKTNFSRDANDILLNRVNRFSHLAKNKTTPEGEVAPPRLRGMSPRVRGKGLQQHERHMIDVVLRLHRRFEHKYGSNHNFPAFRWQPSFRDHIIRDEQDYQNHLQYICNNALKHGLVENAEDYLYMWIEGMLAPIFP